MPGEYRLICLITQTKEQAMHIHTTLFVIMILTVIVEVAHAVNYIRDPWGTLQRSKREAGVYDNQEERNVISTVESNWANEMGEPVRTNHYGKFLPGVDQTEFVNKKMD
jgi:hypothetical protein